MPGGVKYLGTVQTRDGRASVLAQANDESGRQRAARDVGDGLIFTEAQDMPSLEELLQAHDVLYAVLETALPAVDEADVHPTQPTDWRGVARERLAFNIDIAGSDDVMDEDYVFLAALDEEGLDTFLHRAELILSDDDAEEAAWMEFLDSEAEAADAALNHVPLTSVSAPTSEPPEAPLLLGLDTLNVTFTGGAMGGPRPLVDALEV